MSGPSDDNEQEMRRADVANGEAPPQTEAEPEEEGEHRRDDGLTARRGGKRDRR